MESTRMREKNQTDFIMSSDRNIELNKLVKKKRTARAKRKRRTLVQETAEARKGRR